MTIRNTITFASVPTNEGLKAVLKKEPKAVINDVIESGLRGCGGAGFPTGIKWKFAAKAEGKQKTVICNADEGEPGTFKDRVILAEWPDLVFEGMTIAGYAIGATMGIVYLRAEYAYMRPVLEERLAQRRSDGLLGKDIASKKGFNFDIHIHMGSGAYVCGEESALIESLEGKRGEPRNRPPFPVEIGYENAPTIVNNVESLAWVSTIFEKGPEWFKQAGTEDSPGYKLMSISGDVKNPGVYEFPFGTRLSEILEACGGEDAKAVAVGGASGTLVPPTNYQCKICFEDVPTGGSIIVFGKNRSLLDVAENFQEFFADESCGQCTICRLGNVKLLEGIRLMKEGKCSEKLMEDLCALGESMQVASKCGLGQTSPNVFLSVVQHFHEEIPKHPVNESNEDMLTERQPSIGIFGSLLELLSGKKEHVNESGKKGVSA